MEKQLTEKGQSLAVELLQDCRIWISSMKFKTAEEQRAAKRIKAEALRQITPLLDEWTAPFDEKITRK